LLGLGRIISERFLDILGQLVQRRIESFEIRLNWERIRISCAEIIVLCVSRRKMTGVSD
jgi:hypothetical protein